MLDDLLVFEHKLRQHVSDLRSDIASFLDSQGLSEYQRDVSITYNADDGGRWRISHYANKITVDASGAELYRTAEAFMDAFKAQHGNKTLRGLIAAS